MQTTTLIALLTLTCLALVIYHHVGYPWVLSRWTKRTPQRPGALARRGYVARLGDRQLPGITVIVPAHDEATLIAEKVRNLAALDYPPSRLKVVIACDGCRDETAARARAAHAEPECRHLDLEVREYPVNRGKVAVLNQTIASTNSELVALSDVSALVSIDALLRAASAFADPRMGVVAGGYRLLAPGSAGESAYWDYQLRIKRGEAALGAPLGTHGAFYLFRRRLFSPLAPDTINDDFLLPMSIVADGYRAIYDTEIMALELERADPALDQRRRRRIAAGNLQQAWRLRRLLHPRHRGIAFAFASGKALRAVMPFLLLATLAGSLWLAPQSLPFALLAAAQLLVYSVALWRQFNPRTRVPGVVNTLHYLVSGHVAGLVGGVRYLAGLDRGHWRRATLAEESSR
jgi:cellulose synthase/poly-beta-1,6-N-acetylglucosamine synthase-like glycosyltransferase